MTSENLAAPATRPIRVRIAPSPTGDPHVGTAYIGLLNYLYAKQRAGQFVLRIEDTDRTRFVSTSEQMIFDSLKWVGLTWDEGPDVGGPYGPYRQSERTEIYREHAEILLANGHAYRSFETAEELEAMRQQQIAAKTPPRYNGAHRHLTPEQIQAYLAEGRPYTIRLKVPENQSTTFTDELRGPITFDHNNVDDQVLLKSDGYPTYHLANVVDDHLMRITDVIRAEEWISSTPKHVLLYKAFGWDLPRFWHMPLLRNIDKSKISKRKNPVSLVFYQQSGYLPEAVLNFLGLLGGGMAQPTEEEIVSKHLNTKEGDIFSLAEMLEKFDFKRISLGGPVFDLVKLKWLNGEYLRKLTPEAFFATLRQTILSDDYIRAIAPLVQARMETLGQFGDMTSFFFSDNVIPPDGDWIPKGRRGPETLVFTQKLLAALEATPWTPNDIENSVLSLGSSDLLPDFLKKIPDTYIEIRPVFEAILTNFYKDVQNKKLRFGIGDEKTFLKFHERCQLLEVPEQAKEAIDLVLRSFQDYAREEMREWSVAESFMLLRAIITGRKQSPPILDCLVVFGKARTLDRIRRFIEAQKTADARRK